MPKPIENVSSELFDFLKNRFDLGEGVDEDGQSTNVPSDMKLFSFDFTDKKGEDCGCVVISLLDDSESSNSLKIYFGQELADADVDTTNDWFVFLKEIRQFAKMHVLGFDVRNINKSRITKRDIEPMFESTFGPIDGTVKTSRQPLDNMEIIIKHSNRVNPKIKNSRSRRIHKIYISNSKGERFLLPFKSLQAARAMARHINTGGNPYDATGTAICVLVDEMMMLRHFVRVLKNKEFDNPDAVAAIQAAHERYNDIKKKISSLSTNRGYVKNHESLLDVTGEVEDAEYDNLFGELDDSTALAVPHVMKAFNSRKGSEEEDEFSRWVAAAHGEDGKEQLTDDEQITEADEPCSAGWGSPLSFPSVKVPQHFHTPKEIANMTNTSGEMSPLSLLNSREKEDEDDNLNRIIHLSGGKLQPKKK